MRRGNRALVKPKLMRIATAARVTSKQSCPWLRAMLGVGYNFGWRKGELLNLRVHQVDVLARTIRLDVGETKNNSGRLVKMPDEVFTLISALVTGRKGDDYVFTRDDGKRVKNFRKLWTAVCKRAEVLDLLFHDLRRTGARNLRRLGIAESVATKITGHKTPSIFKRCDITDESDLIEVAARLDQKRQLAENKSHEPDFEQSSNRKQLICHFYDYYQHDSGEQYSARCPA